LVVLACGSPESGERVQQTKQAVAPPGSALCEITVNGVGTLSMEDDYLPHVITCENGGANLQALKAQAIAARSVAYYSILTSGSICDGQGCQVYSCGAAPSAKAYQAVKETAGMYLTFANTLTYGFYVAGDSGASPPGCIDYGGSTSHYVTYNQGKTGGAVEQTSLGYIGPPGFGQNRGCMSQWGARCLENSNGYDYGAILRFYYGEDIGIVQATGSCVAPANAPPAGYLDQAGCDKVTGWTQDPDEPGKSIDVHLYFGGPAGSGAPGVPLNANVHRDDLCAAIGSCTHGFERAPPLSLFDGQPHAVHAYGIDSAGGANAELGQSPLSLNCAATKPEGVRRHVTNPESLAAWKLDLFWHNLPLDDATISSIPEAEALPAAPALVQADDGTPEVWLVDGNWRRHVPNPAVLAAWGWAFSDIVVKPASEVYALEQGPAVRPSPVTVTSSAGKVDLIDDALSPPSSGTGGQGSGSGGAGSGGTGGKGGKGGKGGSSSGSADRGGTETDDGCSVSASAAPSSSMAWLALVLFAAALRRRNVR
jgi:MYXO-CTERM domain-containing protein